MNDNTQSPVAPTPQGATIGMALKLSDADFNLLSVAAKKAGLTVTDFVLEAAKKRAVRFSRPDLTVETDDPRTSNVKHLEVWGARKFPLIADVSTLWVRYQDEGKTLKVFCHTPNKWRVK